MNYFGNFEKKFNFLKIRYNEYFDGINLMYPT